MYHPEVLRDFQNLFEGGDLFARELRAFPFSEIQLAQVVEVHIRDVAVDAGLEVGEVVVGHHEMTVSGDLNVTLEAVRTQRLCQTERGQRVFGGQMGRAAMGDDERAHGMDLLKRQKLKNAMPLPMIHVFTNFVNDGVSVSKAGKNGAKVRLLPSKRRKIKLNFSTFHEKKPKIDPFLSHLFLPNGQFL